MDRTNAERQRRYIARLKAKAGSGGVNSAETVAALDRATDLVVSLEARIAELEAELARQRDERNQFGEAYWKIRAYLELRTEGLFTRAEFNKVRSVLHPDKAQGEADKKRHAEAFDIFSRCEKLLKKEPLPPPPASATTREELMQARLQVMAKNKARGQKAAATRAGKKPRPQLGGGQAD
jgi:hypothetical protein